MNTRLIIIGGVAAGMSAASKARRINPDLDIQVFTDEDYISYAGCGLPYFIGGKIDSQHKLIARTIEQFSKQKIVVHTGIRAEKIIPGGKMVSLHNHKTDRLMETSYDKLVIAAGARPFIPKMGGLDLDGIFTLRTITDSLNIRQYIAAIQPRNALVVGGGYIGLEMIENLLLYGCKVTLAERSPHILPNMDGDIAQVIHQYLTDKGVIIYTGTDVIGFSGSKQVQEAETSQGKLECDFVLLSAGVVPNSELAADAGITLGTRNAIKVNEKMETNLPDIYAAGDCAVTTHLVSNQEVYIPMGTTANKQGKVAGENAAGGSAVFKGVLGTGIARIIDMEVARTGLCETECDRLGIAATSHTIKAKTAAPYCPAAGDVYVKLTVENNTDRILGGQIAGYTGAAKRIDTLAAAITAGSTVVTLADMDLAYSPPFSPVWDPVLIALNQF